MMDLSVIIVNWNSADYLRDCIRSIQEYTEQTTYEIIVVDNASPDRAIEKLVPQFPDIKFILSRDNLGFSRGNNLGARSATGDYVLLLNPDTKLVNPAIDLMMAHIKATPDAGIVGARHVNPDLSIQTCAIQKFPTILNQALNIEAVRLAWPSCPLWNISALFGDLKKPVCVEVIPGACEMLRRTVFEKVGGYSEDYFMYGEDIELNYKVSRLGLKNYLVPEAIIIHYGGRSSSQRTASQWAMIMQSRAMLKYYAKTHGTAYAFAYRVSMGISAVARLFVLGLAFPFVYLAGKRQSVRSAMEKWAAILKWSVGMESASA
jgi:GT2 family glycosyltransferase